MDDALHAALEIGLERQHIAVRGQGHELVLQIGQHIVLQGEILDLAHAALVQAAQFAAQTIEFRRAFVPDQAVVGNTAAQRRRELHGHGRGLGQLQQMRPVARGLGRIDGGLRALGQAQHFAQSPEGVGVGPGLGALGGVQQAADIGKGGQAEALAAVAHGAGGPGGGFLIEARGQGHGLGVRQGSKGQGAFAAHARAAEPGQIFRDFAEFEGIESAGMNHDFFVP